MSSDALDEARERRQLVLVASELGISMEELDQLEFALDEDSSDDGLVYSVTVRFEEGNPPDIMSKIRGLDSGNYVYLNAGLFDESNESDESEE
ncbi:hypothetical protein J2X19_000134 [Rhodoferax ferrireducens]|uniref:Uncharacterized protein n=1 Tax=Rhodoferax ferrireducens TaxID=192843 RepID=A0ABU2C2C0_9BURK|nr:hypothetical protein [Rhodoferax ferrireducens]MDR7375476.1 hypothetical protein [Rhodoferax ferrireducens]